MMYPVYVNKEPDSAYGASLPDFPGCFSAADELEDLPFQVQEAVEVHFAGEDLVIPQPSVPEDWFDDSRFQGGYWMLVDIDLARISRKSRRLNVSLPDYLVQQIDDYVAVHHQSRSGFLAQAAEAAMRSKR